MPQPLSQRDTEREKRGEKQTERRREREREIREGKQTEREREKTGEEEWRDAERQTKIAMEDEEL